jgi:type I restriction enzyme S subunit
MGSEWSEYKLGDVTKWSSGGTPPKMEDSYWNGDIPWISASSMYGNRYRKSANRITEKGLEAGSRLAPKDSILLLVRGSMLHQKIPVGIAEIDVAFNQDVKALKANEKLIDPWFLLFWFMSKEYELLEMVENTGIGAGKLDTTLLQNLKISIPPKDERKRIVTFAKALDDKIELNRRMNATLEGMAQALFKSWFVDFDPVIDNALAAGNPIPEELTERAEVRRQALADGTANREAAKQFPAAFQLTEEMGWISEGWKTRSLETLIELIGGGTPKTSVDEYWHGNIPWFSVVDAPNNSDVFVIDTDKKITELGVKKSSTKVLRKGATIISARGTVGKCALVGTEMAMNQSCYGIHGANGISDIYTYYTIREFVADLQQRGHGSVFNTITRDTFKSIHIPFGKTELTHDFDKTVNPFLERIRFNLSQNVELTSLRDTLLPKLISGELRIPEAEKLTEKEVT